MRSRPTTRRHQSGTPPGWQVQQHLAQGLVEGLGQGVVQGPGQGQERLSREVREEGLEAVSGRHLMPADVVWEWHSKMPVPGQHFEEVE